MSGSELNKRIRDIRPSLRLIHPWVFYLTAGFCIFNIAISIALFLQPLTDITIVNNVTPSSFHAIIFGGLGIMMFYGLATNSWNLVGSSLAVGILTKSVWAYALLFATPSISLYIVAMWIILDYIQIVTYMLFKRHLTGIWG